MDRHTGAPEDFTFTTVDVPGATNTGAAGINNLGHIVGGYNQSSGFFPDHGFLDVGGMFTVIDDPNATSETTATDINRSDQIVGSYNFTDPNHRVDRAGSFDHLLDVAGFDARGVVRWAVVSS
ncbi:MAG: hypothetical protein DMG30_08405 [Acidobacteria bacterium]|nr:MAG: hypothetical protein DMG30_08405 [Acidobacteriota bacterium]